MVCCTELEDLKFCIYYFFQANLLTIFELTMSQFTASYSTGMSQFNDPLFGIPSHTTVINFILKYLIFLIFLTNVIIENDKIFEFLKNLSLLIADKCPSIDIIHEQNINSI